jgi:glyoxylase-like metal-dependent hydrolase (beta-lactamase superfamily II)
MLQTDVGPGVHRLRRAATNLYLVEVGDRILLIDAGLPQMWRELSRAMAHLGKSPADVAGVLLTHGHFDHVGMGSRIQREWDVPVWVHRSDSALARHPYRYQREQSRVLFPLRHPASLPILGRMAAAGALWVRGVKGVESVDIGADLPGGPQLLATPGHTFGHVAVHFPDRDTLIVGDALVTLDPYTGRVGPRIVPGAATANTELARRSLTTLVDTRARVVLPGHGEPWTQGISSAVDLALNRQS